MPLKEIYFDISTTLDPKSKNVTHFLKVQRKLIYPIGKGAAEIVTKR